MPYIAQHIDSLIDLLVEWDCPASSDTVLS